MEASRFLTLDTFPSDDLNKDALARDGFVYVEDGLVDATLVCYYCGLTFIIREAFKSLQEVLGWHDAVGRCIFKLGLSDNVPMPLNRTIALLNAVFRQTRYMISDKDSRKIQDYNISTTTPRHSDMSIEANRIATLKKCWNVNHIGEAGFFFRRCGYSIRIICFFCDCKIHGNKIIKTLGNTMDARVQHVIANPECEFIRSILGQDFVDTVDKLRIFQHQIILYDEVLEDMKKNNKTVVQRQLYTTVQCKICLEYEATVLFLPCGHMISCLNCSFALDKCAVCRTSILGKTRCYI